MQNISSHTLLVFTKGVPTYLALGERDTGKHKHSATETVSISVCV